MDKQDALRSPTSCLNKAGPFEPIFVIRAKDPLAAQTVRLWAQMAINQHEPEKVDEAMHLADQMEKWRDANVPTMPSVESMPAYQTATCAEVRRR